MKAPTPLPTDLRLVERHTFLASVDSELRPTLEDRTETPGVHLLVVYTDTEERFAEVCGVGPSGDFSDLREATRSSPTGLAMRYVVPCQNCPQFMIPKGCPTTGFPISLLKLLPPPILPDASRGGSRTVRAARVAATSPAVTKPSPFAMTARARSDEWGETRGASDSASYPEVSRGALDRQEALRLREAELDAREQRQLEVKRALAEEGFRLDECLSVREGLLARRELALAAKLDALTSVLCELDGLRAKIDAILGDDVAVPVSRAHEVR